MRKSLDLSADADKPEGSSAIVMGCPARKAKSAQSCRTPRSLVDQVVELLQNLPLY
jgi:hypothetical protein